jgi:hypothetical protein
MWRAKAPAAPTKVVNRGADVANKKYYATKDTVNISWTAPTELNGIAGSVKDNTNFAITNYNVFYGMTSAKADTAVGVAYAVTRDATTDLLNTTYAHDVSKLKRGSFYYTVQATTIAGTSVSSAMSAAIVSAQAWSKPGCVTVTTDKKATSDAIYISWTAPTDNGGSAISGYKIYYSINDATAANWLITSTGSSPYTFDVSGAGEKFRDGQYYFQVAAVNPLDGAGVTAESPKSDICPTTGILSGAPLPPDAPTKITGPTSGETCSSVDIAWTAPLNNGGSAITGYKVYYGTTSDATTAAPMPADAGVAVAYKHDTSAVPDGIIFY